MIPKIIWTYWDTPQIPQYIQDCINTWRIHCKNDWDINILNRETIKKLAMESYKFLVAIPAPTPPHRKTTHWARYNVLDKSSEISIPRRRNNSASLFIFH